MSKKLMAQMEKWTESETPSISQGHQTMRPIGMSGHTLSKNSKTSFHKSKVRAGAFAAIAAARKAQKARANKKK